MFEYFICALGDYIAEFKYGPEPTDEQVSEATDEAEKIALRLRHFLPGYAYDEWNAIKTKEAGN